MLNYSYKYTYNYMIMSTYTYFFILIRIHVSIYLFKIVDCYMNAIGDMRNEMDFYDHYKMFEYNHDFEQKN